MNNNRDSWIQTNMTASFKMRLAILFTFRKIKVEHSFQINEARDLVGGNLKVEVTTPMDELRGLYNRLFKKQGGGLEAPSDVKLKKVEDI